MAKKKDEAQTTETPLLEVPVLGKSRAKSGGGWDVAATVKLALYYSDQFFTHYIYRRAARKEKSKHIVSHILLFRLCRSTRKFLSWEPHFSHYLLAKEKHIYDTYLCKYDYCDLLSSDYR